MPGAHRPRIGRRQQPDGTVNRRGRRLGQVEGAAASDKRRAEGEHPARTAPACGRASGSWSAPCDSCAAGRRTAGGRVHVRSRRRIVVVGAGSDAHLALHAPQDRLRDRAAEARNSRARSGTSRANAAGRRRRRSPSPRWCQAWWPGGARWPRATAASPSACCRRSGRSARRGRPPARSATPSVPATRSGGRRPARAAITQLSPW